MARWILVPLIICAALAAWWLVSDTDPGADSLAVEQPRAAAGSGQRKAAQEQASDASRELDQMPGDASADPASSQPPSSPAPSDPMHQQLRDIARDYERASRFPAYSKPLTEQDWQLLHPRAFVPREAEIDGVPGLGITIELERYLVDSSRPLPVRVVASSSGQQAVAASVSLRSSGAASESVSLVKLSETGTVQVFAGVVPPALLATMGDGEAALVAQVSLPGTGTVNTAAQLKLYSPEARLLYLGTPYVDGANLVIPVLFEVKRDGYYRVRGNLFDQQGGRPVSHLNAAFMLTAQNRTGLLRVHAETLRAMQAPGPYVLRDIDIVRSPSRPGDPSGYGSAVKPEYPAQGFSLDSYSDEPYVDPLAEERQQFLEKLSGEQGLP